MKNFAADCLCLCSVKSRKRERTCAEDYVANAIGSFGTWQAAACLTSLLTRFIVIWNMTAILFLTPETEFVCAEFNNSRSGEVLRSTCYEDCVRYEYYNQGLNTTLVTDFGLICEKRWLASFSQTVLMLGILIGTMFFGWVSDRYGRRRCLVTSGLLNVVFMLATPFSPNFLALSCFRLITGIATGGVLTTGIVYVLELVGIDYRDAASSAIVHPDALAQASMSLFAYFTSTWNTYVLSYTIVAMAIVILILFLPESPRWLISRGRVDEAINVITKAAIRNKLSTANLKENIEKSIEELQLNKKEIINATYLDLFKTKRLALTSVCVFVVWTISGACFFGISQYMSFVGSDLYIVVLVLGLIQMPAGVVSWILNKHCGRRISSIGVLVAGAVVMISLIFTGESFLATTILGVIGFGVSSTIFTVIYIYVSELFPTPLRNMAFGFTSCGTKLGAMAAPFIANLRPQWLPSVVFAGLLFLGAVFCLPLPETKGQNLKDTVE